MYYVKKNLGLFIIFVLISTCSTNSIISDENLNLNIVNCNNTNNKRNEKLNNFDNEIYIVGHAYGKPGEGDFLPEKLVNYIDTNVNRNSSYIALTGDFVRKSDIESFIKVKKFIDSYFIGYFISVGNHEVDGSLKNYFSVFEEDFYYQEFNNFLLISANFSTADWLPSDTQQQKINELIKQTKKETIFLLSHQLFWQEDANFEVKPNSYDLLTKNLNTNSLNWIEQNNSKNFVVISGDYGAFGQKTVCYIEQNKLFIANGIGNHKNDSILKISENKNTIYIEEIILSK